MKKLFLIVLFGIFSIAGAFAQASTGLTVTTQDGNPFQLYLNGIVMNNTASPYVQVYGLQSTSATLHIVTQDGYCVDQQINLNNYTASNFELDPTVNGYQLNLLSYTNIPIGEYASLTVLTEPIQQTNVAYNSYYYRPAPAPVIHIGFGPAVFRRPAVRYAYGNYGWNNYYHRNYEGYEHHNENHFNGFDHHDENHFNGFDHHDESHFNGGQENHNNGYHAPVQGNAGRGNNAPRGSRR